ncbi:MAG: DUF3500 domain-containing protein [Planctomyces sp.]
MRRKSQRSAVSPEKNGTDRRMFLQAVAGLSVSGMIHGRLSQGLYAAPTTAAPAETLVSEFFQSLSAEQRGEICLPFDHELKSRINANWHITKPTLGEQFFTSQQREIVSRIVRGVTSEDGYERFQQQMEYDSGGIIEYSVAVFGEPGNQPFEFVLTGRHLTLRADGNFTDRVAFGGPIVYGHGEEEISKNLFFYQTQQANEVYRSLSKEQTAKALLTNAPAETSVQIQGEQGHFPGIRIGDLSPEQQGTVEKTLSVLLAPYRASDVEEAMQVLKESGGLADLHMAFYRQEDIGNDEVWDIWRVEGPSFVWHFRGAPHVHAYINIGQWKAKA